MRLAAGLHGHAGWYVGDGTYGDGPKMHWDYYNSFVIQPTFGACLAVVGEDEEWRALASERTYPVTGRSITYRGGAFQALAAVALAGALPDGLPPAQVRGALTAVLHRTLKPAGTFDARGWLQIGLAGHQPRLGESYTSTGSLYLCSEVLLPLGLPADDPFWTGDAVPWTSQKVWSGAALPADHVI